MSREELIKAIEQNGSAAAVLLREIFLYFEGSIHDAIGDLADLETADKATLVAAINELVARVEKLEEGGVKAEYDEVNKAIIIMSGATYDEANEAIILDGGAYDETTKTITL